MKLKHYLSKNKGATAFICRNIKSASFAFIGQIKRGERLCPIDMAVHISNLLKNEITIKDLLNDEQYEKYLLLASPSNPPITELSANPANPTT